MITPESEAMVSLPNETDVTCWLAAHEELVRHWEEAHGTLRHPEPQPRGQGKLINAPCAACLPLLRQEALLFARVERLGADGVSLALEGM
jgi:hypothetical protein